MSELKCEFPEGCRLDLYAKVVKAKRKMHSTFWYTLNQLNEKIKVYIDNIESGQNEVYEIKDVHK